MTSQIEAERLTRQVFLRRAGARTSVAGAATIAAGALWLLVWWHQRATHGPTELNEMRLALGLTWMDSAKFLVAPFLLLLAVLVSLGRPSDSSRVGGAGFALSIAGLGLLSMGVALVYWSFSWGSYAQGFDGSLAQAGGVVQALGTLTLTLGLILLTVDRVRRKALSAWIAPLLPAGALTTFWLTPVLAVPGLLALLVGSALLWKSAHTARREPILVARDGQSRQQKRRRQRRLVHARAPAAARADAVRVLTVDQLQLRVRASGVGRTGDSSDDRGETLEVAHGAG